MLHGRDAGSRQIIGMNMIGEHIIGRIERRHATLQTLDRQTIGGINPGRSQNRDDNTRFLPPIAQATLGIDSPGGTCTLCIQTTGFVDLRAAAIAINACGTNVNQAPW